MNKLMKPVYILCLIFVLVNVAHAEEKIVIESKIFRGLKVQTIQSPIVIISSFSEPYYFSSDPVSVEADNKSISHLKSELSKIYQIEQIDHLTMGNMIWDGKKRSLRGTIQLDDVRYPIYFSPEVLSKNKINLRVEMFKVKGLEEPFDKGMGEKLLDTKMALNFNDPVILGFPSNGEVYFLSILITKRETDDIIKGSASELQIPLNSLQPLKAIHQVKPVYPQKCKENMIEGSVILEINTDRKGNVVKLRILKPVHPDLDNAAKNALKQWKFEPVVNERGKPVPVAFLVSVNFKLRKQTNNIDNKSTSNSQADLEKILDECADYCERLANVVLFFVCQEEIKEEIYRLTQANAIALGPDQEKINQIDSVLFRGRAAEKNVYVYDYQLIRKDNRINERRIFIEENGKKKYEKDAQLKTKLFRHKNIIFGPIGLLSRHWQQYHDYKIVKEVKYKGEKAIIIEAVAKPSFKLDHLSGKVWIGKNDSSILKIEWNQESIKNYENIEEFANKFKLKPRIKLISEYGFEKNGIRFPNRYLIEEAYDSNIRNNIIRSKKNVIYKAYKFFTVETEVKH